MRLTRLWPTFLALLLLLGACAKKTVSFNSRPEAPATAVLARADSLTATRDTVNAPSLSTAKKLSKEEERKLLDKQKDAQRKSAKKKKNIFLGDRIKKGFVKSGRKGRNQVIEVFYYLKVPKQPNTYAPAKWYFNPAKKRLYKDATEQDLTKVKVLHGPYKKMQGGKVVETGFYNVGTRHLRWERFNRDNILLSKTHYEQGYPRDAHISYYDGAQTMIKEVLPYVNGKLEGDYVSFKPDGQLDWTGQFENGRKVGSWTKYWGFRNRRHYEYEYGESGYEPEAEPVLFKEYNRNGVLIYEKDKLDKREADARNPAQPRRN
ncbi:toxin-antitoxin system YwqK family antitoxin [Hymenobacter sp. B81]|uniref:toxin-antitoxin system YwqK family antitoxin n=1 Tax=Hymenobacter sp. B81 TaxID=3344878 RepID=UPI0037DC53E4